MRKGEVGCGGKRNKLKTHLKFVRSFFFSFLNLGGDLTANGLRTLEKK